MNWKLLFVFCLTLALLVEVDAASRDRKKKKNRNQDDDDEETTGGSMIGDGEQGKKDDNKDGAREREREGKEKEKKKESESSSEEDEEKKNGTEVEIPKVNGGEKLELTKKPVMETSSRFKREHHVEPRKGLLLPKYNKNFEASDLLQGLPTAETILQQGPTINIEDLIRKKRDHHEGHDEMPKSQTHARQGLAAAGEQRQEVDLPKSQTHARQGHAANPENQKKEVNKREANESVPEETYGDPISTTPENQVAEEKREKRDSDDEEIGPKVASTPMSLNNPANPEGAAVFTEIINSPQMRKRRQIITENGQLYDAHPNEEHAVLEELIFPTQRAQKMKRETELKRDTEVNGGEQLKLSQSVSDFSFRKVYLIYKKETNWLGNGILIGSASTVHRC
ncbi:unnamed protein product, partial [Mesorhabditis belari]|uniref:Uncharacterized protein n=1 Tax=Mesorhabditis belari TaxID=2138241 RepID=A0AAF3EML1_9BILA